MQPSDPGRGHARQTLSTPEYMRLQVYDVDIFQKVLVNTMKIPMRSSSGLSSDGWRRARACGSEYAPCRGTIVGETYLALMSIVHRRLCWTCSPL